METQRKSEKSNKRQYKFAKHYTVDGKFHFLAHKIPFFASDVYSIYKTQRCGEHNVRVEMGKLEMD